MVAASSVSSSAITTVAMSSVASSLAVLAMLLVVISAVVGLARTSGFELLVLLADVAEEVFAELFSSSNVVCVRAAEISIHQ